LTAGELAILLSAGLNVGIVQHVSPDGWTPTEALGTNYGSYAAQYAKEIGYLIGANIFCDLEMVSSSSLSSDIISFCNAWWEAVNSAGYIPGLYVGYNSGLTPGQLYSDLKFQHYWAAYNYTDGVAKRGVQIQQHTAKVLNGISFDPNTVSPDNEGGLPMFLSNS
jgi:hypothetical protein